MLRCLTIAIVVSLLPVAPCSAAAPAELRVGVQQEPTTLDPVVGARAVESDAANLLFDGLFRFDDHGELVPDLAVRVPTQRNGDISRDGLRITYHLVRNARWQDGVPVTSADVKFTFDAIMDKRTNALVHTPYDSFERVDTPDPYTVAIVLKHPNVSTVVTAFTAAIAGAIVPAHLLRSSADINRDPFGTMPVGSGPYRLVSWTHGSDMVFEANPGYFRGAPKIARIVWRFIPDENAITSALRSHEIDMVDRLGLAAYSQLGSVPGLIPALTWSYWWEHLAFNTASGPLADVRVRQALCSGMNIDEIYAKVVHGVGDLGVGLQQPRSIWYDRSLRQCRFDPERANALLDAAGWRRGPDGMRSRDGKPLQISFSTVAGIIDRQQTQVLLQSRWRDLGIDTVLRSYPPSTFFAPGQAGILYSGKTDVTLCAFPFTADPDRSNLDTAGGLPPQGINHAFWHDARVDALEAQALETYDEAARKRAFRAIQRLEAEQLPYLTLRWWTLIVMHDVRVRGVRPPPIGSTYWNVEGWTMADERSIPTDRRVHADSRIRRSLNRAERISGHRFARAHLRDPNRFG